MHGAGNSFPAGLLGRFFPTGISHAYIHAMIRCQLFSMPLLELRANALDGVTGKTRRSASSPAGAVGTKGPFSFCTRMAGRTEQI